MSFGKVKKSFECLKGTLPDDAVSAKMSLAEGWNRGEYEREGWSVRTIFVATPLIGDQITLAGGNDGLLHERMI